MIKIARSPVSHEISPSIALLKCGYILAVNRQRFFVPYDIAYPGAFNHYFDKGYSLYLFQTAQEMEDTAQALFELERAKVQL